MDIEIRVDNEYGLQFHKATRELGMKKAGLIGGKWRVIGKEFLSFHGQPLFEDDQIPWHHVDIRLFDGTDKHTVTLSKGEIEHHIDKRKLKAWQHGVSGW